MAYDWCVGPMSLPVAQEEAVKKLTRLTLRSSAAERWRMAFVTIMMNDCYGGGGRLLVERDIPDRLSSIPPGGRTIWR